MFTKVQFSTVLIMVASVFLGACTKKSEKLDLVYCSEGSPSAFNPQVITDGTSSNASTHTVFNRLLEFKYGTTEIIPSLALEIPSEENGGVSNNGKTYIFKLRKDVSFHRVKGFTPSRNLNAEDVVWSINRMRLKNHPYYMVGGGRYEYFDSMGMGDLIEDVKKIDDQTIQIDLTKPEAPFLANIAMHFMSVVSKEYAEFLAKEGREKDFDYFPVGTGPFIFQSYEKDTLIRFKANKNYFDGAPKIKRLIFAITPDPSVRFQKLKGGECHFITQPAPADLDAMKKDPAIELKSAPGLNVGYVGINIEKKPYDSRLVRRALNHALNVESYINAIYMKQAELANGALPPSIGWAYQKNLKTYPYDPAKAAELLKEAGFPDGFETELWVLPVSRPYNPNGKKMGEMMQADLAAIKDSEGKAVPVKVKLISYDWPTYLKKVKQGEHQLVQFGWNGDNGDPDNFLNILLSCEAIQGGSNLSRWCNKEYTDLINQARLTTKQVERKKFYDLAQDIFTEEAPWVPLVHSVSFRAMSKDVQAYKMDPFGHDIFYEVYRQ